MITTLTVGGLCLIFNRANGDFLLLPLGLTGTSYHAAEQPDGKQTLGLCSNLPLLYIKTSAFSFSSFLFIISGLCYWKKKAAKRLRAN